MPDVRWVKIKSWHIVRTISRGALLGTYCGRWLVPDTIVMDELPMGEKSCETCTRLVLQDA